MMYSSKFALLNSCGHLYMCTFNFLRAVFIFAVSSESQSKQEVHVSSEGAVLK